MKIKNSTRVVCKVIGFISVAILFVFIIFLKKNGIENFLQTVVFLGGTGTFNFVTTFLVLVWIFFQIIQIRLDTKDPEIRRWCLYANKNALFFQCFLGFVGLPVVILEEVIYRGSLLFILFWHKMFWVVIVLPVQAVLWGTAHFINTNEPRDMLQVKLRIIYNPIEGVILGLITLASGSILLSVFLHFLWNSFYILAIRYYIKNWNPA